MHIADGFACRCIIRTTQLLLPCVHRVLLGGWLGNMKMDLNSLMYIALACIFVHDSKQQAKCCAARLVAHNTPSSPTSFYWVWREKKVQIHSLQVVLRVHGEYMIYDMCSMQSLLISQGSVSAPELSVTDVILYKTLFTFQFCWWKYEANESNVTITHINFKECASHLLRYSI